MDGNGHRTLKLILARLACLRAMIWRHAAVLRYYDSRGFSVDGNEPAVPVKVKNRVKA
jgi:hypothetical protein